MLLRTSRFTDALLVAGAILTILNACMDPTGAPNSPVVKYSPPHAATTQLPVVASRYTAIDLGTLPLHSESAALGINDHGHIVGYSCPDCNPSDVSLDVEGGERAFLWRDGNLVSLGTLGGNSSFAMAINNSGHIVGGSTNAAGVLRAVLWKDGELIDLGTLGGAGAFATDINEEGQIVGRAQLPSGLIRAFLWQDGVMKILPSSGFFAGATAINNRGQIIGWDLTGDYRAVRWESGEVFDLGILGDGPSAAASDINDEGMIVGAARMPVGPAQAYLWHNGTTTYLAHTSGASSRAWGLNDLREVVGNQERFGVSLEAFLWNEAGGGALPSDGGTAEAMAINEGGQIVGVVGRHATLWRVLTPVELLAELERIIGTLVELGELQRGEGAALAAKLTVATAMLNDGKLTPARNQLEAFVQQLEALISSGKLGIFDGENLIAKVGSALRALEAQ